MKKTAVALAIAASLSFPLESFACVQPDRQDYSALLVATGLVMPQLVSKLYETYCYDFNSRAFQSGKSKNPVFLSPNLSFLKFFASKNGGLENTISLSATQYKFDILSYILISPHLQAKKGDDIEGQAVSVLKKYDPQASSKLFENPYQTLKASPESYSFGGGVQKNYAEMISYLTDAYSTMYTFARDSFGNNVVYYSMITDDYRAFSRLAPNETDFYARNSDDFALVHLAFGKHYPTQGDPDAAKKQALIDDYIASKFKVSYAPYLSTHGVPFYYFIEMMKDSNPDLYSKIKAKAGSDFFIDQKTLDSYSDKFQKISDALDYVNRANKHL